MRHMRGMVILKLGVMMLMLVHVLPWSGSILEGGGQILRNAAALSAVTGVATSISNIRAGRSKPGLRPQHLTGLQLIERVSGGSLEGAVGSQHEPS